MIRRLTEDEVVLYREVRLRALADAPTAFGSTFDDEARLSTDRWAERLTHPDRAIFVAEEDGTDVGLVAGAPDWEDAGAAFLLSMWVAPSSRGRGVGAKLVRAVIDWARSQGHARLRLHVTDGNTSATRLYTRSGFQPSGEGFVRDRDGAYELEMLLHLDEP